MIVQISVIGTAVLVVLGVLFMVLAAIRSMTMGKQDVKRIGLMAVPVIAFVISYLILGDLVEAAIGATGIMMGLLGVAIVVSGVRGALK